MNAILLTLLIDAAQKFGPAILEAFANLIIALIKSLSPEQQKQLAANVGVSQEIINEVWPQA